MASRLEELMEKLYEQEGSEEGFVKLSEEDIELLEAIGQAYIEGLLAGVEKLAEEEDEDVEVVDLDGDGEPDHIVANPEDVVEEVLNMVEEGEITPEEAEDLLDMVEAQIGEDDDDIEEKTAGLRLFRRRKSLLSRIKGWAKGTRKRMGKRFKSLKKKIKKNKKVLIPIAGLTGLGIAGAAYGLYRYRKSREE